MQAVHYAFSYATDLHSAPSMRPAKKHKRSGSIKHDMVRKSYTLLGPAAAAVADLLLQQQSTAADSSSAVVQPAAT